MWGVSARRPWFNPPQHPQQQSQHSGVKPGEFLCKSTGQCAPRYEATSNDVWTHASHDAPCSRCERGSGAAAALCVARRAVLEMEAEAARKPRSLILPL